MGAEPPRSMEEAIEEYLGRIKDKVAPATAAWRRTHLRSVFLRYVRKENKDYRTVTKSDIERMLLALNATPHYKRGIVNTLEDFYGFLKTDDNPAKGIVLARASRQKLVRVPSIAMVNETIDKMPRTIRRHGRATALRNRLLAELAYGSGLRRIELARLNIEDIDSTEKTVYVTGKYGATRVVPLTRKAIAAAREYLALRKETKEVLLLSERKRRMTVGHISKLIREKLGMHTHLLRHAFATHLRIGFFLKRHPKPDLGNAIPSFQKEFS